MQGSVGSWQGQYHLTLSQDRKANWRVRDAPSASAESVVRKWALAKSSAVRLATRRAPDTDQPSSLGGRCASLLERLLPAPRLRATLAASRLLRGELLFEILGLARRSIHGRRILFERAGVAQVHSIRMPRATRVSSSRFRWRSDAYPRNLRPRRSRRRRFTRAVESCSGGPVRSSPPRPPGAPR